MNLTIEERQEKALNFFKEKFDINLQEFSPQQAKVIIDEINEHLTKLIETEQEKTKKLNLEILIKSDEIVELTQELNNQN